MELTTDDYQRAAIRAEQTAKKMLDEAPGHHKGYLAQTYLNFAKAYYHADSSNQRLMRREFAPLFEKFHEINRQEARGS